ncbi:MAG: hypothetical protein ACRCTD_13915 [Beijerinckiaceae bacterium]
MTGAIKFLGMLSAWIIPLYGGALAQSLAPDDAAALLPTCEKLWRGDSEATPDMVGQCRALWALRLEAAQKRVQSEQNDFARRQRDTRHHGSAGVPSLDDFMADDLRYGDIIYTRQGPRVFVGRDPEKISRADIVPLTSPRSPYRGMADQYIRAAPPADQ